MERPESALAGRTGERAAAPLAGRRVGRGVVVVGGALVLALAMWYYVLGILIPQQVTYAAGHATPRGTLSAVSPSKSQPKASCTVPNGSPNAGHSRNAT